MRASGHDRGIGHRTRQAPEPSLCAIGACPELRLSIISERPMRTKVAASSMLRHVQSLARDPDQRASRPTGCGRQRVVQRGGRRLATGDGDAGAGAVGAGAVADHRDLKDDVNHHPAADRAAQPVLPVRAADSLGKGTTVRILRSAGVAFRNQGMTGDQTEEGVVLYRSGWSLARLADHYGCDPETVRKELTNFGVVTRKPWER